MLVKPWNIGLTGSFSLLQAGHWVSWGGPAPITAGVKGSWAVPGPVWRLGRQQLSQQQVRTWPHAGLCQLGHFLQACHLPPWSCSASLPGACQCEAHRELPPRLKDVSGATGHLTCSREAESETAAAAGEPKGLAQPCSAPPRHPLFPSQPALGSPSKGASLFGHVWPHQDLRELPVDRIPVFTAPELREGGTTAFLALI